MFSIMAVKLGAILYGDFFPLFLGLGMEKPPRDGREKPAENPEPDGEKLLGLRLGEPLGDLLGDGLTDGEELKDGLGYGLNPLGEKEDLLYADGE